MPSSGVGDGSCSGTRIPDRPDASVEAGPVSRSRTNSFSDVRPEFLLLGLLAGGTAHGYELDRRFRMQFSGSWKMSRSQIYSILKRLEEKDFIEPLPLESIRTSPEEAGSGQGRGSGSSRDRSQPRLLSLTPSGREAFDSWLSTPTICSPRFLHLEFVARLHFASLIDPSLASRLFKVQREAVGKAITEAERRLHEYQGSRTGTSSAGFSPTGLSLACRLRLLASISLWMDEDILPGMEYTASR